MQKSQGYTKIQHICHPGGLGWVGQGTKKIMERKKNISGTEKDAVVTMTH